MVYERIRAGQVRALRLGKYVRIHPDDLERWEARDALSGYTAALREGKVCVDCGAADDLRFHHVDPSTKRYNVACAPTMAAARAEAAKCVVLCPKCHSERHKKPPREKRASGHVEVRKMKKGDAFYAKLKLRDGSQRRRRLGKVWSDPGEPPQGWLTREQAETRLAAILARDNGPRAE